MADNHSTDGTLVSIILTTVGVAGNLILWVVNNEIVSLAIAWAAGIAAFLNHGYGMYLKYKQKHNGENKN